MIPAEVILTARREIEQEQFRAAVEAKKAELRKNKTFWARVAAALPFTITITRKPK